MTPRIIVYVTDDPAAPPNARAVAHAFDAEGRLQVATATAAEPQVAADRLSAVLTKISGVASKSAGPVDPQLSATRRAAARRAVEARRRKTSEPS